MDILTKTEALVKTGQRNFTITYEDGNTEKARLFIGASGQLAKFRRGSSKRGYLLSGHGVKTISPIIPSKTDEQKWIDGWQKVKSRLEASGLWAHLIEKIDTALSIGYSGMKEAYSLYWENFPEEDAKIAVFQEKFPLLVKINDEGNPYIDCSTLWSHHPAPIVKKMRFVKGKYNETYLDQIKEAMQTGSPLHLHSTYQYDVSFEYQPKNKRAWYSEEFRGTGNGHYYLALDATHALFSEND